jgi:hypothetical protein
MNARGRDGPGSYVTYGTRGASAQCRQDATAGPGMHVRTSVHTVQHLDSRDRATAVDDGDRDDDDDDEACTVSKPDGPAGTCSACIRVH